MPQADGEHNCDAVTSSNTPHRHKNFKTETSRTPLRRTSRRCSGYHVSINPNGVAAFLLEATGLLLAMEGSRARHPRRRAACRPSVTRAPRATRSCRGANECYLEPSYSVGIRQAGTPTGTLPACATIVGAKSPAMTATSTAYHTHLLTNFLNMLRPSLESNCALPLPARYRAPYRRSGLNSWPCQCRHRRPKQPGGNRNKYRIPQPCPRHSPSHGSGFPVVRSA